MKLSTKVTELSNIIAPAVAVCDVELWGLEFVPQGKKSMMRIYIEVSAEEKAAGQRITIEQCAAVTHQVSGVLEVHDPIAGEYTLEVSSPGVDRPFFYPEQLTDYLNETLNLRLIHAIDSKSGKRRKINGTLIELDETKLVIRCDNEDLTVLFNNIDKANHVYKL